MNGPFDSDKPSNGYQKKRDEKEAERLAGLGEDKYDKMYDSEEKKRLERHRDWREKKREEDRREFFRDSRTSDGSDGSDGISHSKNNGRSKLIGYLFIWPLLAFLLGGVFVTFAPVSNGDISVGLASLGVYIFLVWLVSRSDIYS